MRLLVVAVIALAVAASAAGPVVQTTNGPIEGYVADGGLHIFRGVPFGAPPTGNNRFKSPVPPQPWTSTRKCLTQAPICPQIRITDNLFLGKEDCLYLDVYVPPRKPTDKPLPVMFWIYGGGYSFGDNWEFGFYDAQNLVKARNFIVVSPNYRLGPLGFLALDQLKKENAGGSTGNYALQDQQLALQWVRDNIAQFGGDPKQVNIFGESAGAFSVCWHLVSPGSRGLYRSAILESGTCDTTEFFRDYSDAVSWSNTYAKMCGCDPAKEPDLLACLRKLETGKVMGSLLGPRPANAPFVPKLYPFMPWGPAIDGAQSGLLDLPINLIKAGKWSNVTIVMGTNKDEGTIFILAAPLLVPGGVVFPLNAAGLNKTLEFFFGANSTVMAQYPQYYPQYNYKTFDGMAAAILRDYFFACATRRVVRAVRGNSQAAYMYHFTYKGDWIEDPVLGDYHSAELEYVWANPWPPIIHAFSQRDRDMSNTFGTYWANMAYFGNPNGNSTGKYPAWPVYDLNAKQNQVLDVPTQTESNLFGNVCDWWDSIGPSISANQNMRF